jgi:hypothetical protein
MNTEQKILEFYFDRYPEVPLEVIIKEDLLRLGIKFTDAAMKAAKGCRLKSYFLFSYDRIAHDEMGKDETYRVPEDIVFSGGPYNLKRTVVRVSVGSATPYLMDAKDGAIILYEGENKLATVEYPTIPEYYSQRLEDGTGYGQMIPLLFGRQAFATINRTCSNWSTGDECLFCDINANLRDLKKRKGKTSADHVVYDTVKDPEKIATVLEGMHKSMFIDNKESLANRMVCFIMTAGTIKTKLKGMTANEFHLSFVNAIRGKIGNRTPIALIVDPGSKEDVKRLYEAGVTSYNPNYEVWDKKLFKTLCPGKEKNIGRDEWFRRIIEAVDIFGDGRVSPNYVAGVEMAQPYGFKDVDQAIASLREGLDFFMSHGVVPHPDSWCIEPLSALGGHPVLPLDYYIKADQTWYETWLKYDLPPNPGWGPIGNGRGVYGNSAFVDMREKR